MAEQADQTFSEVGVVRDYPERRTISGHNQLLSAEHSVDRGIRLLPAVEHQWNQGFAIGERWPHDGYREALVAIGLQQTFFAGDLVPRIVPIRIGQRSRLGNLVVRLRLLISAGRTDEHELAGASAEQFEVAFDVGRGKSDL